MSYHGLGVTLRQAAAAQPAPACITMPSWYKSTPEFLSNLDKCKSGVAGPYCDYVHGNLQTLAKYDPIFMVYWDAISRCNAVRAGQIVPPLPAPYNNITPCDFASLWPCDSYQYQLAKQQQAQLTAEQQAAAAQQQAAAAEQQAAAAQQEAAAQAQAAEQTEEEAAKKRKTTMLVAAGIGAAVLIGAVVVMRKKR